MALGRAATGQPYAPLNVDSSGNCPYEQCAQNPRRRRLPAAGGRSHVGPPPSGCLEQAFLGPAVLVRESNPQQPDYWSGALSTELTSLDTTIGQNPFTEHTSPTALLKGQGGVRRWPGRIVAFKEAPVGVEPT